MDILGIDDNKENLKTLSYNKVIVKKNNLYGIVNMDFEEIMGAKYTKMIFDEPSGNFIVQNEEGKYGILNEEGNILVALKYDNIEILNYSPVLYKAKKNNKYGIIKEDGSLLADTEYDEIGYPKDKQKDIKYTLIIPKLSENTIESIVVCKDKKYGLISLETGKIFVECKLEGLYCKNINENDYYIVVTENDVMYLNKYIEEINTIKVNM